MDYIPKELFSSYMKRNQKDNKVIINNDKDKFNFDSNYFQSSNFEEKNNDLKSKLKNESNNDFKISQNEFNISESCGKSENLYNSNNKNNNEKINSNLHLTGNLSKEINSNKRYNEEINQSNSKNKTVNLNSNIPDNNIISNIVSNESSTLRHNISNYNGLSDNFINSHLNISNTLTNNSNVLSSKNNYLDKIKLRELENKEKYLIELEAKRNKRISDLIEKQKIEYSEKVKEIEKIENKNINDNYFIEKDKESIHKQKQNNENSQVITFNNDNKNKENNGNNNINKNNEVISYFNKMKKENIKNKRNSNRSSNLNYKTSSSFYTKRTRILSPFISSAITDNNISKNFIHQNYTTTNFQKAQNKNKSKSTKKLNSSHKNISNNSSHIMKSIISNNNNPASSLQMLNLFKNCNNSKCKSKINQKTKNKKYNPKGKAKIQEKYNIYFNCFIPDLYEEQRQKLLNEKKIKKAKSTTKIKQLEDYIGPNLYNEEVEAPDFGYICYKTNKKINPKYSLNHENNRNYYNSRRISMINSINTLNNDHFGLNINLRSIYNKYENDKNNNENENDIFNYSKNNFRKRNNLFEEMQNYPKTEYNEEIMKDQLYQELYNKAFKQFNYLPEVNYYQQPMNTEDIKWKYS